MIPSLVLFACGESPWSPSGAQAIIVSLHESKKKQVFKFRNKNYLSTISCNLNEPSFMKVAFYK